MKDILNGFKSQWSKWTAVGLLTILACMAYVSMAKEWSAFRVLLIAVIGLTLGLVQSQIPGPSKVFNWQNSAKVLVVALAGLLIASFAPTRTANATRWVSENIDSPKDGSGSSLLRTTPRGTTSLITRRIPIKECVWSEWVEVPIGLDFQVNDETGSGHIEVKFLDGRIVSDLENGKPTPKWRGVVRNCSFQIRRISGEGTAIVTMTRG